jgi:glycosyltransferase involved in cell wall biosynthesis
MSQSPKVSIIVPVYNGADVLERCLQSLFKQDYSPLEIIIVDDGSTDNGPGLVKEPARLVKTKGRTGAGAARNLGAKEASGEVLLFTDCDCVVPESWVSRVVECMKTHDVVAGGGGYAGAVKDVFVQNFAYEELAFRRRKLNGFVHTLVSNNLFCRKDVFFEMGGYPEYYKAASSEDMEFSWELSKKYKLWWDANNGVYHDFTSTLGRYLGQQVRFARDAVPMLLGRHKDLLTGQTHHGHQLYLETAFAGLALLSFFLLQFFWAALFILAVIAINSLFLTALIKRRGILFALQSLGVILLRDFSIIWGCGVGLIHWIAGLRKEK